MYEGVNFTLGNGKRNVPLKKLTGFDVLISFNLVELRQSSLVPCQVDVYK